MRPALTQDDYKNPELSVPRGVLNYGWFYFKERNFSLGVPPKCGTGSVKQFIWMNELENDIISIEPNKATCDAYFVVRDPLDRFCSLWKSKCRDAMPSNHRDTIKNMTPEELMNFIESGVRDVHWSSQTRLLGNAKVTLIPHEFFGYWWKQSKLGKLGCFNATEGEADIGDELRKRILIHYADDLILYHKAQCDFCWDTIIRRC